MSAERYLYLPYRLARLPLEVVDSLVIRRLPAGSRPRTWFDRAIGTTDLLASWLLHDSELQAAAAARLRPPPTTTAEPDETEPEAAVVEPEPPAQPAEVSAAARRDRAADAAAKQHDATRANQNLSTIRQQVAAAAAVAEAREHAAEAADPAQHPDG